MKGKKPEILGFFPFFLFDFLRRLRPKFLIMSSKSILKTKSFQFATRIIKLSHYLKKNHNAFELATQVFKSGTAIGALVREAEFAESSKDFIHKMHIGLKESNETEYWIELAMAAGFITRRMFNSINGDNKELLRMLISTVKTTKSRIK